MNDRHRKRLTDFVAEFFSTCFPTAPSAEIERLLGSLSDDDIQSLWKKIFVQVTSDNTRYAADVCSRNGWFIDMGFPGRSAPEVADLYENGQSERADSLLTDYYHERANSIAEELTAYYPKRATILRKAFTMHHEREYDLSVPLFLIQADGICIDAFRREFFRIKKGALAARRSVDGADVDWIWDAVAEPFRIALPIATHSRGAKFLNRHRILHGQDLAYGTEINSLKAISLLAFLHGLDRYREEHKSSLDCLGAQD